MQTQSSKEQTLEMVQMRLDGYSFQEIADKYGVSRQCIHQKLSVIAGSAKPRPKGIDEKVIYPNLAKWISENRMKKYELSKLLGLSDKSTKSLSMKLYGERDFSMTEIKKLLEITGQTFEHLFCEKDGPAPVCLENFGGGEDGQADRF